MIRLVVRDAGTLNEVAHIGPMTPAAAESYVAEWITASALGGLRVELVPTCCPRGAMEPEALHAVLGCSPEGRLS